MGLEPEISRPLADFAPTIWENPLAFLSFDDESAFESYGKQVNGLKEKIKNKLMASAENLAENVEFIDLLCRLGVSYHFETEIEEQLRQFFDVHLDDVIEAENDYDLHTISIIFHTLRQYGYKVSCDVFNKFKNEEGKFDETLIEDARGMLSLYEAAQWSTHGEEILDEALEFTKPHLESLSTRAIGNVARRIRNALKHSYHKGIQVNEARLFITSYEEDESHDETLLRFAKLNYRFLQLLYRRELNHVFMWYKDSNITSEFPYAKDRIVESYITALGTYFEPRFSQARIDLAKFVMIETVLDDTYDAYATMDELNLFTDVMDRLHLNSNSIYELPGYMKYLYRLITKFYNEIEKQLAKEGRSDCLFHAKDSLTQLAKGYHEQAVWLDKGYVPTFEEYTKNGMDSCGSYAMTVMAFVGLGDLSKLEAFEWLHKRPKAVEVSMIILRFLNDLSSHEFENKRAHVCSSIQCYMKQYGVSEKEAIASIRKLVRNAWKDINEELMRPTEVSRQLLKTIHNISRVFEMVYRHDLDGFTHPKYLKNYVVSLLIENIPI